VTVGYKPGEFVAGEMIYLCFGQVLPGVPKGLRKRGKLDLRGFAEEQRPLKKAETVSPRAYDRIDCVSARYEANETDFDLKRKVTLKGHTGFEGYLIGDAVCTVQKPHPHVKL
jgi:hypothetical protein